MYLATVVEVVRRRAFSDHYLEKSKCLSERFYQLHNDEVCARSAFQVR